MATTIISSIRVNPHGNRLQFLIFHTSANFSDLMKG
jgi:hypothetical protein